MSKIHFWDRLCQLLNALHVDFSILWFYYYFDYNNTVSRVSVATGSPSRSTYIKYLCTKQHLQL